VAPRCPGRAGARAQDSWYRGLVALGIGAVGGTAVAAFSSADAARLASRADDAAAIKARPDARAGSSTVPVPAPGAAGRRATRHGP